MLYKMCEKEINESESENESEIDSIDLLMESYVNLLELFRELSKEVKINRDLLEEISVGLKQMQSN